MWQRIQTLYLAISTILMGSMFFLDRLKYVGLGGLVNERISYISYWPFLVFLIVIIFLSIISLTTYKIRRFQMRTTILLALVTFGFQCWLGYMYYSDMHTYNNSIAHVLGNVKHGISNVFPIVCVILDYLAFRGIFADQLLVESAYSLRKAKRH